MDDRSGLMAPKLNLIVIYVEDIVRSKAFYSSIGLEFTAERHGSGPEHFAATISEGIFEIYPQSTNNPRGCVRLGFEVDSTDAMVGKMRDAGTNIIAEPSESPWGRRAIVEDPDGNRVELTERLTQADPKAV